MGLNWLSYPLRESLIGSIQITYLSLFPGCFKMPWMCFLPHRHCYDVTIIPRYRNTGRYQNIPVCCANNVSPNRNFGSFGLLLALMWITAIQGRPKKYPLATVCGRENTPRKTDARPSEKKGQTKPPTAPGRPAKKTNKTTASQNSQWALAGGYFRPFCRHPIF